MKYTYSRSCFNISSEIELPEKCALFALLDAADCEDITSLDIETECEVFTAVMATITDSRVYLSVDGDLNPSPVLTFTWNIYDSSDTVSHTNVIITKTVAMSDDLKTRINDYSRRFLSDRLVVVDVNDGKSSYKYCVKSSGLKIRRNYVKVDKGLRMNIITKRPVINSLDGKGSTHEDLLFWIRTDRMTNLPWWWRLWHACTKERINFVELPPKYSTRSADLNTITVKF